MSKRTRAGRTRRPTRNQARSQRIRPAEKPPFILWGSHQLPKSWRPFDWLVPLIDNHGVIHHGHGLDEDDHRRCGPALFCCSKAAALYLERFPDSGEAQAEWELLDADHIARWLERGVPVLYFVFCDPQRPRGLWGIGLAGERMYQTLYKQLALQAHLDRANRLA